MRTTRSRVSRVFSLVLAIALLATGSLASAEAPKGAGEQAPPAAEPAAAEGTATGEAAPVHPDGETMDLTGEDHDSFAPYNNVRHPGWALLPMAMILIVLLHLRKSKPQPKLVKGQQA